MIDRHWHIVQLLYKLCKDDIKSWVLQLTFEKKKENSFLSVHSCGRARQWSHWARRALGQGGVMSSEHRAVQAWPLPGAARAVWTGDGWWLVLGLVTSYTLPGVKWLWWEVKWGDILQSVAQSLCRVNVFCAKFCFVCSFLMWTFRKWLDLALLFATQCTLRWILSDHLIMCSCMLYVSSS